MPSYSEYLRLDGLLSLQVPTGADHDEMLFIVIHQSYELWFKQMLHEVDHLRGLLEAGQVERALHTFKRVLTILKMLVAKIDILETMTPLEFLAFRDRLESGSGFQSRQFRELEFALGNKRRGILTHFAEGTRDRAALERRWSERTLWDSLVRLLARRGLPVPHEALERDITRAVQPSEEMQQLLVGIYRTDPTLATLCERFVDLDEGIQEWRYRHVKMVERTIGTKMGTGGSTGAEYLRTTLSAPLFPDLWAIRSRF